MGRTVAVSSKEEIEHLEKKIIESIAVTVAELRKLLEANTPTQIFYSLRFHKVGRDPLDSERPLNFVEQLNQTFTYLTSLKGARIAIRRHKRSLRLNLGTARGWDLESLEGDVVAEAFAATSPDSNNKLETDCMKLETSLAKHKYVFFHCPPGGKPALRAKGIRIVKVDLPGAR